MHENARLHAFVESFLVHTPGIRVLVHIKQEVVIKYNINCNCKIRNILQQTPNISKISFLLMDVIIYFYRFWGKSLK